MNEVLDEIVNGQLFPAASYYKKQQNSTRREDVLKPKINKRSSIWVSDKIIQKMDISNLLILDWTKYKDLQDELFYIKLLKKRSAKKSFRSRLFHEKCYGSRTLYNSMF